MGDLPAPTDELRAGFSMWFDREQWGAIMDGLIAELDISRKRKANNAASNSDARAEMCAALLGEIGRASSGVLPEQPPCIGNDPACPCQDGDTCHYVDASVSPYSVGDSGRMGTQDGGKK